MQVLGDNFKALARPGATGAIVDEIEGLLQNTGADE
jgi:hypothetical protein